MSNDATVLFVPGLRDETPEHWQSILQLELELAAGRAACVPRMRGSLSCATWVVMLDNAISAIDGPVILAAHSAGCMMVTHWAARLKKPVLGALLATPPDFETPLPKGYPQPTELHINGWLPNPLSPLPFPSIVAASRDDPLAAFDRVARMADAWGSKLVDLGKVGHLNPASGYGPWPRARDLLAELGA